ncbi:MAG: RibD family protein [Candidatus Marinimicrobia bacterium]|nr:RibD family protein [Candidatus Neomarinimicrobiota bacterium]
MASTLDGKIGPANTDHFVALGSQHDLDHLVALRDQADAVLFGASTFRAWPKIHQGTNPDQTLHHFIMSRSLDLDPGSELFQDPSVPVTIITSSDPGEREFPPHVALFQTPEDAPMSTILDHIRARGYDALMVEGGGQVLGQLIAARAIQELYLTLIPQFIGQADAPGLLGSQDLGVPLQLEIIERKQIENETYFHIRISYS